MLHVTPLSSGSSIVSCCNPKSGTKQHEQIGNIKEYQEMDLNDYIASYYVFGYKE